MVSPSSAASGRTSRARETNRLTASVVRATSGPSSTRGSPSDPTGMIRSPATPKPSRLVATTTTSGQPLNDRVSERRSRVEHVFAVVEHQQQLPVAATFRRSRDTHPPSAPGSTPSTPATSGPTASGDVSGASSHNHAPCRNRGCTSAANWSANRVFPAPPTPVSVTIRADLDRLADIAQLGLAPDELRHLRRQVPRQGRTRTQRRKPRRPELQHPLRTTQITKTMLTQILKLEIVGQKRRRSRRAHHLTAPRDRHHPRRAIHRCSRSNSRHAPQPHQCAGPYELATDPANSGHRSVVDRSLDLHRSPCRVRSHAQTTPQPHRPCPRTQPRPRERINAWTSSS